MADFEDEFVNRLQKTVRQIKESREMEERFMTLKEMLQDEYSAGREEGKAGGKSGNDGTVYKKYSMNTILV